MKLCWNWSPFILLCTHNELLLCRELSVQDLQGREQIFTVTTLWPGFTSSLCSHVSEMCKVTAWPGSWWWRKASLGQRWVCLSPDMLRLIQAPRQQPLPEAVHPDPPYPLERRSNRAPECLAAPSAGAPGQLNGPSVNLRGAHCSPASASHHFPTHAPPSAFQAQLRV